jgi:hypothetical protein
VAMKSRRRRQILICPSRRHGAYRGRIAWPKPVSPLSLEPAPDRAGGHGRGRPIRPRSTLGDLEIPFCRLTMRKGLQLALAARRPDHLEHVEGDESDAASMARLRRRRLSSGPAAQPAAFPPGQCKRPCPAPAVAILRIAALRCLR